MERTANFILSQEQKMTTQEKLDRIIALAQIARDYHDMANRMLDHIRDIVALTDFVTAYEEGLGKHDGKIHAVKAFKERTGMSLIDSKKTIENWFAKHGLKFYQGS